MWETDIYISAGIRGPGKGTGKVMYRMRARSKIGWTRESGVSIAEYDHATESRLVLYALRDAMQRFRRECRIIVYTECGYIASALEQNWPEIWEASGWKNSRGKEVKDSVLWQDILHLIRDQGHVLEARTGAHEYSGWMRWQMEKTVAEKNVFREMTETGRILINTE